MSCLFHHILWKLCFKKHFIIQLHKTKLLLINQWKYTINKQRYITLLWHVREVHKKSSFCFYCLGLKCVLWHLIVAVGESLRPASSISLIQSQCVLPQNVNIHGSSVNICIILYLWRGGNTLCDIILLLSTFCFFLKCISWVHYFEGPKSIFLEHQTMMSPRLYLGWTSQGGKLEISSRRKQWITNPPRA